MTNMVHEAASYKGKKNINKKVHTQNMKIDDLTKRTYHFEL